MRNVCLLFEIIHAHCIVDSAALYTALSCRTRNGSVKLICGRHRPAFELTHLQQKPDPYFILKNRAKPLFLQFCFFQAISPEKDHCFLMTTPCVSYSSQLLSNYFRSQSGTVFCSQRCAPLFLFSRLFYTS